MVSGMEMQGRLLAKDDWRVRDGFTDIGFKRINMKVSFCFFFSNGYFITATYLNAYLPCNLCIGEGQSFLLLMPCIYHRVSYVLNLQ